MSGRAGAGLRAGLLLAGAVGLGTLSAWVWLLARQNGQFVLASGDWVAARLPTMLVLAAVAGVALGGLGVLASLRYDQRLRGALTWGWQWAKAHRGWALALAACGVLGAIDFYELLYDAYAKQWGPEGKGGLRTWMLREDVRGWLLLAATVMGGLAVSALWRRVAGADPRRSAKPQRMMDAGSGASQTQPQAPSGAPTGLAESLGHKRRWWVLAFAAPVVFGVVMCVGALDGIPHFADALTYLMQGRILWSGRLGVDMPRHPELFQDTLFFLTHRYDAAGQVVDSPIYYGKYPIGWPLILGLFDKLSVPFLANALLAGASALLTGLMARQFASRRVAVLAALWFGLSPWVWFHGASFASHAATTFAVTGFLWLFLVTVRRSAAGHASQAVLPALGAGLFLGLGVLVRPADAAMFAFPAALVVLYHMIHRPKRWVTPGLVMAAGALVGVAVYAWVNSQTVGNPFKSPYQLEPRWTQRDWDFGVGPMAFRGLFQFVELNGQFPGWGLGGVTLALMGIIVVLERARRGSDPAQAARGLAACAGLRARWLWLPVAGATLFFVGNMPFGFTNVWWGSRWLLPMAPVLAVLAAHLVDAMMETAVDAKPQAVHARRAAQTGLCVIAAGLVVGLVFRYGGQFHQNKLMPPHAVSAAAQRAVQAELSRLDVRQAVVAMPAHGGGATIDARAGVVFMRVPFENNDVIYVRAIDGWADKARASFPRHSTLLEIVPARRPTSLNDFTVKRLPASADKKPDGPQGSAR